MKLVFVFPYSGYRCVIGSILVHLSLKSGGVNSATALSNFFSVDVTNSFSSFNSCNSVLALPLLHNSLAMFLIYYYC
jgi:hypothetical protein